jgi:hypothetical protein
MVNEAETAHFAADRLQHPRELKPYLSQRGEGRRNCPGAYLSSIKTARKTLLMAAVAGE